MEVLQITSPMGIDTLLLHPEQRKRLVADGIVVAVRAQIPLNRERGEVVIPS